MGPRKPPSNLERLIVLAARPVGVLSDKVNHWLSLFLVLSPLALAFVAAVSGGRLGKFGCGACAASPQP